MSKPEQSADELLTKAELMEQLHMFRDMYITDTTNAELRATLAEKDNIRLIEALARHDLDVDAGLKRKYDELHHDLEARYQLKNAELEGKYMLKLSKMHERRTRNALMYARIVQDYAKLVGGDHTTDHTTITASINSDSSESSLESSNSESSL